jgi:hypothetical protein
MSRWYTTEKAISGKSELFLARSPAHVLNPNLMERMGFKVCSQCGESHGVFLQAALFGNGGRISCLCTGIKCRYCGRSKVRRPFSDHFRPGASTTSRVPWFGYLIPCRKCQAQGRGPTVTPYQLALDRFPEDAG